MASPWDQQPLTPAQEKQIADRNLGSELISRALAAVQKAKAAFSSAETISVALTQRATEFPAAEVDVNAMVDAEHVYRSAQDLVRNLGYYLQGAQGWRAGAGQPNHETYVELINRLRGLYPDADAAVNS